MRITEESLECTDRACGWVGYENQAVERYSEDEGTEYDCPSCGEICAHFPMDEISETGEAARDTEEDSIHGGYDHD